MDIKDDVTIQSWDGTWTYRPKLLVTPQTPEDIIEIVTDVQHGRAALFHFCQNGQSSINIRFERRAHVLRWISTQTCLHERLQERFPERQAKTTFLPCGSGICIGSNTDIGKPKASG